MVSIKLHLLVRYNLPLRYFLPTGCCQQQDGDGDWYDPFHVDYLFWCKGTHNLRKTAKKSITQY